LVQTYFNPDEHWQALEVAHHTVFGYGHLTWEWQRGLRSYVHPLVFAAVYKILAVLHLDNTWFMRKGPRIFQSVIAAVGDLYLYKLSHRLFGERAAQWTLFCQLSNWFNFFCMPRTFANCMETVLTTIALYHWWPISKAKPRVGLLTSRQVGIISAGLACVMRPTSAITWLYVGMAHWRETSNKCQYIFEDVLPIG
jgi:phosphatidylinositol glycan class B